MSLLPLENSRFRTYSNDKYFQNFPDVLFRIFVKVTIYIWLKGYELSSFIAFSKPAHLSNIYYRLFFIAGYCVQCHFSCFLKIAFIFTGNCANCKQNTW